MFKKSIKFHNFDGVLVEKEFYFHLSKAELLQMAADGGAMAERIKRIIAAGDGKAIIKEFEEFIKLSVGMRSTDGERFIKSSEAQSYLLDSPAYDELLMELCTNADAAAEFIRQLVPEKMQKEMQEALKKQTVVREDGSPVDPFGDKEDDRPAYQRENRQPNNVELIGMTKEQLAAAFEWWENRNKK